MLTRSDKFILGIFLIAGFFSAITLPCWLVFGAKAALITSTTAVFLTAFALIWLFIITVRDLFI